MSEASSAMHKAWEQTEQNPNSPQALKLYGPVNIGSPRMSVDELVATVASSRNHSPANPGHYIDPHIYRFTIYIQTPDRKEKRGVRMVGPHGLEPSTSSVSRSAETVTD